MRWLDRAAFRLFGGLATASTGANDPLHQALQRAHIPRRTEVYLASGYMTVLLTVVATTVPVAVLALAQGAGLVAVPARLYVFLVPTPLVLGLIVFLLVRVLPDMRVASRARAIDAKLPYAINYLSTMSSAGATPQVLFAGLARQPIYGPLAQEAGLITRDMQVLGMDVLGALAAGSQRSASARLQDLLQGMATTLGSGADLRGYLNAKADQFLVENRQDQRRFLDSLGVLAESFVTVVVAAPLFLIIILSVLSSFGGSVQDSLYLGYGLVLIVIPLSQFGFGWAISAMTPEA